MPKIVFTQKDKDSIKKIDPGFWGVKLIEVTEKPNAKKDGTNYFFEFQVVSEGSNKDRYFKHLISSKNIGYGFGPVAAALLQCNVDELPVGDYDTDPLIGKTCIMEVELEEYEGSLNPKAKNFFSALNQGIELSS